MVSGTQQVLNKGFLVIVVVVVVVVVVLLLLLFQFLLVRLSSYKNQKLILAN